MAKKKKEKKVVLSRFDIIRVLWSDTMSWNGWQPIDSEWASDDSNMLVESAGIFLELTEGSLIMTYGYSLDGDNKCLSMLKIPINMISELNVMKPGPNLDIKKLRRVK